MTPAPAIAIVTKRGQPRQRALSVDVLKPLTVTKLNNPIKTDTTAAATQSWLAAIEVVVRANSADAQDELWMSPVMLPQAPSMLAE